MPFIGNPFTKLGEQDPETGCWSGADDYQECRQAYYLKQQVKNQTSSSNVSATSIKQLQAENQDLKNQLETTQTKYNQLLTEQLKNPEPQTYKLFSAANFILFAVILILAGYILSQKFKISKK